jgi:hypothetical protein
MIPHNYSRNGRITPKNPTDLFLSRIENIREIRPGVYSGSCPTAIHAKGDRSRGLRVTVRDDGALLLWCGAGCGADEIVSAVGLTLSDLFPSTPKEPDCTGSRPKAPRLRPGDLLELVVTESLVCAVAARDIRAGRPLSDEDVARLDLAEETILAAYAEVRSWV